MSEKRSIPELVDQMIKFTIDTGGSLDMYVDICEKSVVEAEENLDGSTDAKEIYEDAKEFLRIAKEKQAELN